MRRPILAANWKMQKTRAEATEFAEAFLPLVKDAGEVDIVIAPPFTALDRALRRARGIQRGPVAAQNVNPGAQGCVHRGDRPGHAGGARLSPTRSWGTASAAPSTGRADAFVAEKAKPPCSPRTSCPSSAAERPDEEREAGRTIFDVVGGQLEGSLAEVPAGRAAELVVAYEPDLGDRHRQDGHARDGPGSPRLHPRAARQAVRRRRAPEIRIQYGGSVKPDNVDSLMAQPDIDGALVGGASLDPSDFSRIVSSSRASG